MSRQDEDRHPARRRVPAEAGHDAEPVDLGHDQVADHQVGRIRLGTQQSEHERAWQDRFRSLVQNASDVIDVVDGNGAIQFATPVMERVLGHRGADVKLLPYSDLVHPGTSAPRKLQSRVQARRPAASFKV